MNSATVDALVFDLDNTLLDRDVAFRKVADAFYDEHVEAAASISRADAIAALVEWDADGYSPRQGMLQRWLAEWPAVGLTLEGLTRWYRSTMERKVEPDPEVNVFLAELNERGVPWGIVTNGSTNQHAKCRAAGLDTLARFVIVSEEAGYEKPDPRIFRDALDQTGVRDADTVMFVGDNPVADIDGAKRFGMRAAWVTRERKYPAELALPDHIVDKVTELRAVLEL